MTPAAALATAIGPALGLLPSKMDSTPARVMLVAIGLQESELVYRTQLPHGPAHGLWMFELAGVRAVMGNPQTISYARDICDSLAVKPTIANIYEELARDDILAAAFARLLLWTDPKPLPAVGAMGSAWDYYVRNWRPGKPRPTDWPANYRVAAAALPPERAVA